MTWFNKTEDIFNLYDFINRTSLERNAPYGDLAYDRCILCGRKVNEQRGVFVHGVNGSLYSIARIDETNIHEAGDMGWWRVGSECSKNIPDAYKTKNR